MKDIYGRLVLTALLSIFPIVLYFIEKMLIYYGSRGMLVVALLMQIPILAAFLISIMLIISVWSDDS